MLYKFRSKSGSDVIMMGPNGDEVLRLIGKAPSPNGIIEPAAMPAAIAAIEQAVAAEEAARAERADDADGSGTDKGAAAREGVSLRQRAWPLVELMKRARPSGHDIVWGV